LWTANLGAAVYGQPVIMGDRVFVGTQGNDVVALDRTTGAVAWRYSLGAPLTDVKNKAGCGNVDPLGITSTMAIDPARGEVFAVGEVADAKAVHHQLVGLDAATGAVMLTEKVDPPLPPGEQAIHLLQRAGLVLANGRVYIGFGGNNGDCGVYHGWLVSASQTVVGDIVSFNATPDGQGGAIWLSGGAPAIDSNGNVYVATGNANPFPSGEDPLKYTESVLKLSPDLKLLASFKDTAAGGDKDLATGNPVLLPNGQVFVVGKTNVGYLLNAADLSKVAAITGVCTGNPDGGPAYDASAGRLYVACVRGGIQVIDLASRAVVSRLAGANSAPIVVGGTVWAATYPTGGLAEFDASGHLVQSLHTGALPHFASPSFAAGTLFLGTMTGVTAFG